MWNYVYFDKSNRDDFSKPNVEFGEKKTRISAGAILPGSSHNNQKVRTIDFQATSDVSAPNLNVLHDFHHVGSSRLSRGNLRGKPIGNTIY